MFNPIGINYLLACLSLRRAIMDVKAGKFSADMA